MTSDSIKQNLDLSYKELSMRGLIKPEESYLCFLAIGPQYIEYLIKITFPTIYPAANVMVLTNTPHLLDAVDVPFNLCVVNIDDIRDADSIENERLVVADTREEYLRKVDALDAEGRYNFPLDVHRFGMKWCLDNGITKFILFDAIVQMHMEAETTIANIPRDKNTLIIHPLCNPCLTENEPGHCASPPNLQMEVAQDALEREILLKHLGADFKFLAPEDTHGYYTILNHSDSFRIDTEIGNEGWVMGFFFQSLPLVQLYYNLWDEFVRAEYGQWKHDFTPILRFRSIWNMPYFNWATNMETITILLNTIFNFYFDTTIAAHDKLCLHQYTHGTCAGVHADEEHNNQLLHPASTWRNLSTSANIHILSELMQ